MAGTAPSPGLNASSQVAESAAELCALIGGAWDCWGTQTPTGYLLELYNFSQDNTTRNRESCASYLLLPGENVWRYQLRAVLYGLGLIYCFIGLATITALYMRAMENIVKQTRKVSRMNTATGTLEVQQERIWNSTVADITLLALGTSSPQISLAIIDSIQHLGDLYIEGLRSEPRSAQSLLGVVISGSGFAGLGPGTLVGSAAFNLLPTLAICVLIPKGGIVKRVEKTRVFIVELSWAIWAYIWLYIMLKVSSPNEVSLWEAILTVLQFPLLILHAYAEDKSWSYVSIAFWTQRGLTWLQKSEPNDLKEDQQNLSGDKSYTSGWEDQFKRLFGWLQYRNVATSKHTAGNDLHMNELGDLSYETSLSFNSRADERIESPSQNQLLSMGGDVQSNSSAIVFLHETYPLEAEEAYEGSWNHKWRLQLHEAMTVKVYRDENGKEILPSLSHLLWHMFTFFWRVLFGFIPPTSLGHGWPAFFCALLCIAGISTVSIQLANLFGCVSGTNRYAIALLFLASGSSFPDLIASKIAVERGNTADSGIANINTSNCINVFVGIGVPWLLQISYNRVELGKELSLETAGLSFSITVYFLVFTLCWLCVFVRRFQFGGELGGPRNWARASSAYFLFLWILFVLLSCLRLYEII